MFRATREAGLARMRAFQPHMGRLYAAERNHDRGPEARDNVSLLAPWLRRRLLREEEVIAAALAAHGFARSEKFVQEVMWRGYFKGWLEVRPTVWRDYRTALPEARTGVADRLAAAEAGQTGIAAFDAWAHELRATGYLHNHARMWFASIWIFTLRLPWQCGADFFLRHLLDGDPASNTCSWRWVAGLHTPGKTYAARSANIAMFTGGRFPATAGLSADPAPVPGANPAPGALREPREPDATIASVRLITEEDCDPTSLPQVPTVAVARVQLTQRRSDRPVSPAVADWDAAALADAAARAGGAEQFDTPDPASFADWVAGTGARQVVTSYLPVGWVRDWANSLAPELARRNVAFAEQRRAYDGALWPHARAGFFGVKRQIPAVLRALDL